MLKKAVFLTLLCLFTLPCQANSALGITYLDADYSEIGFSSGCTYYNIQNFDELASIEPDTLYTYSKDERTGSISNYGWQWEHKENYYVSVLDYVEYHEETVWKNDSSWYNYTRMENHYKLVQKTRTKWLPIDEFSLKCSLTPSIRDAKIQRVRFCADIKRVKTNIGWTIEVDHIPKFNDVIYPEFTWWNSTWTNKTKIDIYTAAGTTEKGHQVLLNVTYDTDMNANFSDIRFLSGSEDTELNYWLEYNLSGNYTDVWVEVDQNLSTNNYSIYMYYGNPAATTDSDGSETFLAFDYFDDAEYTSNPTWIIESSTWTAASGYLTETGDANWHHIMMDRTDFETSPDYLDVAWDFKFKRPSDSVTFDIWFWFMYSSLKLYTDGSSNGYVVRSVWNGNDLEIWEDSGGSISKIFNGGSGFGDTAWHDVTVARNSTGLLLWGDDTWIGYVDDTNHTSGQYISSMQAGGVYIDNIRARKYHADTITSIFNAEEGPTSDEFYNVNIIEPVNCTNTTDATPDIMFRYNGTYATAICQVFINDTGYGVNTSVINDTNTNITINITLAAGIHNYIVNCINGTDAEASDRNFITIISTVVDLGAINYSITYCYNSDLLFIREPYITENGSFIYHERLVYCNQGCSNRTLLNFGEPGCVESELLLVVISIICFVLIFSLITWAVKR
jgi:hypothetical protein